jgi:hypothetical protein
MKKSIGTTHTISLSVERARAALEKHLKTMPQAGLGKGFNDRALPRAVRLAKLAGYSEAQTIEAILKTQTAAQRNPEPEVRSTVERLFADESEHKGKTGPKWDDPDERLIAEVLAERAGVDMLRKSSPIQDLKLIPTIEFLEKLFQGDPLVTVGRKQLTLNGRMNIPGITTLLSRYKNFPRHGSYEYVVPFPALQRIGQTRDGRHRATASNSIRNGSTW